MVEFLKPHFCPLMRYSVIKRGGEKQQNHAAAVEAIAGDRQRAGITVNGLHQQKHQSYNTKHQPDAMADAVGYFLSQRVSLCDEWFIHHS